ncbi:MAG: 5'-nucleotidase [Bacteroidales bacterium]|jgi:2',3'-cyclic-nucleotide 2'-phosphodiesterase (5'-nucleotidase family)|nr:5'-nucleotidase C-terminal domain-containing protein [Bacteroidales bacterium]MDD4394692.1 5'-nucleotidase [Bacteroidales bacterium]
MKLKLWIWVCLLPCTILAQNNSKFEISYEKITLDATHQQSNDKNIAGYFDSIKKINDGMMGVTIGYCNSTLENFRPESPLSNFLTDALLSFSDSVARAHHQKPVDFSLLNFGGIRGSLKQGPITVGNIYNILFDNKIVISSIQGSEVIKLIKKFGDKSCPAYSNIRIVYYNNKPISYTIGDQPIEEDRIYRVGTIDFLVFSNGDKIFENISLIDSYNTNTSMRDMVINYIQNKKNIDAKRDGRVNIQIQPQH